MSDALSHVLPAGAVVTDPDVLTSLASDRALWAPAGVPSCAVRPRTAEQVQATLRIAYESGVAVVPRGAGSGLSGGAAAVDGCIVLSLASMTSIDIHREGMYAVVQPGAVNGDVFRAAAAAGLFYAPDPASREFSTIGGNIATNAGGLCCVKYGVTRDSVLGLEVVLADGDILRTGGTTVKDVAGLDLRSLFVGSEGTLGVVTEATLRLLPQPASAATAIATFDSMEAACTAVTAIVTRCRPSMLEIMDSVTMRAVELMQPMGLDADAGALLLGRTDSGHEADLEVMRTACVDAGASVFYSTADGSEGELLTAARRLALPALERLGPTLLDDVAVPLDQIAGMVRLIGGVAEAHGVTIGTFGHAGDGNLHPTIVVPDSPDGGARARGAFDAILAAALGIGGSITGEHGVGSLKRGALELQLDQGSTKLHRLIKNALDPRGILNPGKALPH
ncbi:MAG: glycolate oxidase [Frankiales bacterium]|nr:glycolate oxidase [Frankiales bacterium]